MKRLSGSETRETFLRYFESKGHRRVHSSSLVPANDPTLLFTNAGMNQFKDVFLGLEKRDYSRATTSQKCVRAGGKHNDLENVGFTKRHHTFFEMLGNFSFGDYFKREAIAFAWELITDEKWFGIPKDKLYTTIFEGEGAIPRDTDAEKFWMEVGVPKERVFALGIKDNFWAMGDTGPCGPCSEIHYDMGVEASEQGHKDCRFPCDCGRYVEIWNLVFMQFDRDAQGTLNPLPKPSIDTGMGLERLAAVLQGVISNYDTDLFVPLMRRAAELTGVSFEKEIKAESGRSSAASLRVIADHARATTFLINDGVMPANEGRGYVLRKIMRRAIRHGRLLGQNKPFLHEMVNAVRDEMKNAYPELVESAERVAKVVLTEETRFAHTLDIGLKKLEDDFKPLLAEKYLAENPDATLIHLKKIFGEEIQWSDWGKYEPQKRPEYKLRSTPVYQGDKAFKLYDTFGLPLDFIADSARDQGLAFDFEGFERAMAEQRERARSSWKGGSKSSAAPVYRKIAEWVPTKPSSIGAGVMVIPQSVFVGYTKTRVQNTEILAIIKNGEESDLLQPGEHGEVVLQTTPFYADSGGQVGDIGWFYHDEHNTVVAEVTGCIIPVPRLRVHKVIARQPLHIGHKVDAVVNTEVRQSTMRNHTATHLLHAALRETLGKHVKQAGSLVDPAHLRFDFSHFTSVADEELQDIEDIVNKEVLRNEKVQVIEDVPIDVAVNEYKAMALFGEKYGERVRVIRIGDFSTELCGGTHTGATGEIGLIKVLSEGSVSSGVRRLEAITGEGSLQHFRKDHQLERVVGNLVRAQSAKSPAEALAAELQSREEEIKRLKKELDQARMKSAASSVSSAAERVQEVNGIKVLAQRVDNLERSQMRTLVDNLRNKLGSGVVVLGSAIDGKVALIVGVTKDLTARVQAGKVIFEVAKKVGGKGGGRPDLAEAGGTDPGALDGALASVAEVVKGLAS